MGSCEGMWGWRWRGIAGAFRASVGVLVLGLGLARAAPPQDVCPAAEALKNLTQPGYQDTPRPNSAVDALAPFVRSFLRTVQPNPFPKDLISKAIQDFEQVWTNQEFIKQVLLYEVGFLVCVAIGILYIVVMPITGFFLACCRCHDNCGGKMYQKQTPSIQCRRRSLYCSAFVITVIIFAGNVIMFMSNAALKGNVDQAPLELNRTIGNLHTFLTAVPQQVRDVVNQSHDTIQEVSKNLDDIGPLLGLKIQRSFRGVVDPALNSVRVLDQDSENTARQLGEVNATLARLQARVDVLQANFTTVKNDIIQTLSEPGCLGCSGAEGEVRDLTLGASIAIPSLNEFQSAVDAVVKADVKSRIKEVEDYFNSIPQRVATDTQDVVQRSKRLLGEIKAQISQVTSDIDLSSLGRVSDTLDQAQTEIERAVPEVERAEHIRWGVCLAISCMVLLVVLCNFLGLILGPLGSKAKTDPTERSCTADCGGTFLLMGAGFSFLFSWLFMIVVLVLFVLGGNVYTLVCKPWRSGELLKFIETPGLIPEMEVGSNLGFKNNLTISGIYSHCAKNQPLWSTLHLYETIDLDDLLNISKYTEQIRQQFENTDITLSTITLLSPDVENQLVSLRGKVSDYDFDAASRRISNVSSINLNTTADKLDQLAAVVTNGDIQRELRDEAKDLRLLQSNMETTVFPELEKLNSTLEELRATAAKVNGTVGEVLGRMAAAQDFLNTNTSLIVKTESGDFLDCQLNYFKAYADWAKFTLTEQVGRCGPVAGALDSTETVLCSQVVGSLNAFWLSLGWCAVFLIPSIIFAMKLAKHYRRMKYSDVYDNHIVMNHIPRAQMKVH